MSHSAVLPIDDGTSIRRMLERTLRAEVYGVTAVPDAAPPTAQPCGAQRASYDRAVAVVGRRRRGGRCPGSEFFQGRHVDSP